MNAYGGQVPPQARRASANAAVVLGVLMALGAAAVNAVFSFGMLFATDSCGTGSPDWSSRICDGGTWSLVVALPWGGLVCGVVAGVVAAVARTRSGGSAWPGPLLGAGVYAVTLAVSLLLVFA